MSDSNLQPNAEQTDNGQGINIDNLLGGVGTPAPIDDPITGIVPNTDVPPAQDPNQPPVNTAPPAQDPASEQSDDVDDFDRILLNSEGLSSEDQQLRNNILSKFGASNTDAKGNLIDANNRIVLSRENLDRYVLDGDLLLDANGNHVNELGEIITNAADVVASNTFITSTKEEIEQEFGFKFVDELGKPKDYPNTIEGNKEFVKDAINNSHVSAVSAFLNSKPELREIFYHLETGGTLDNFVNETFDYSTVDVSTLTREQKLSYIRSSFEKQNLSNSASMLKLLEAASDESVTEATADALIALNKVTENKRSQAELAYQQQVEAQQKEVNDYWADVKGRIEVGKIRDITIPPAEKDKFYDYLSRVVDNTGRSQEQIDREKEDPNFELMISYLRYKKLDINALVNIRARSNKLHSAKERFMFAQPASVTSPASSTQNNSSKRVISLDDL